jgi:hypothetical protein
MDLDALEEEEQQQQKRADNALSANAVKPRQDDSGHVS